METKTQTQNEFLNQEAELLKNSIDSAKRWAELTPTLYRIKTIEQRLKWALADLKALKKVVKGEVLKC